MNPASLLAISVLASAGLSVAITTLLVPRARDQVASTPADALEQRLAALQHTVEEQQKTIERLSTKPLTTDAALRTQEPTVSEAIVEAAVVRWLEKNSQAAAPGSLGEAAKNAKSPKSGTAGSEAKVLFAELAKAGNDWNKLTELWKKAKDTGQLDALVALYEQNAKDNARVPDAHVALGNAYLQKLFAGGMGPEAGLWGNKADKAFDQALELDPNHWGARFQKAVSLSNWPDFLGRKKEAIANFEILIQQQESAGNTQAEGWNTYLMLGNLYSQQGKEDKAKDVWERGSRAFPGNQGLKDKVSGKK